MNLSRTRLEFDNYLPHNFFAEKMVLNCLVTNSSVIEVVIKNLTINTFYFKNHQELFKTILFMYQTKQPIDIITLTTFLQNNGLINKIGGVKILIELINQIPNLVYLDEYLKLIKDKFLRRSLIKLSYKAINSSYMTNFSLETILNEFEEELFDLNNQFKRTQLATSAELGHSIFLELKQKTIAPSLPGLTSGFYMLDSLTQGFQKSDLIILAGRPSIGKTAFSLSVSLNILKHSIFPVLIFSLEMSKEQIMYRLLSMETEITQSRLRSGKFPKTDWVKLNKIIKILSKLPLFIDDSSDLSVRSIRTKIKTLIVQYKTVGLVIIDYLQLMENSVTKDNNRAQELSKITRGLKNLAREFNIPIIALSQLSRNSEIRNNKKPILSDLRDSGSIEQDADLVLMLYQNKKKNSNLLENNFTEIIDLIIAKQRNGPTGNIQLQFDKRRTKYFNINSLGVG